MNLMTCKICGGNDIKMVDETIFQCESCGCKYSVEQARALFSGDVNVTNLATVDSLLTKALAEIDMGDMQRARGTLDKALELQPDNLKVWILMMVAISDWPLDDEDCESQSFRWFQKIVKRHSKISQDEIDVFNQIQEKWILFYWYFRFGNPDRVGYLEAQLQTLDAQQYEKLVNRVAPGPWNVCFQSDDLLLAKRLHELRSRTNTGDVCLCKATESFDAVMCACIEESSEYICLESYEYMHFLLENGALPSENCAQKFLVTYILADYGDTDIIEACLKAGADPNSCVNYNGKTISLVKHPDLSNAKKDLLKKYGAKTGWFG